MTLNRFNMGILHLIRYPVKVICKQVSRILQIQIKGRTKRINLLASIFRICFIFYAKIRMYF